MRICVVSTPVFRVPVSGYSGLEHLAWLTAKGLAEKGHEVAIVAPEGSECPGCEVISCGREKTWDERSAYGTFWQKLLKFDVVIDHTWQKWSYILKAEGKLTAPVLGVTHAPVNTMYGTLPPGVEKPCFVCISEDQAKHFEALHSRPARVVYNGVDHEFYKPLNIPRSDRFLFLARFSTIKGPDIALEACYRAGVGLDLVGDTSITNEPHYFEQCKQLAERTSPGWDVAKGKQFRIIGGVSRGEAVWWMSQAFAMIHPNQRFREPFGLAPVESMLCECPVIAWSFGAMRETVDHGHTGYLVNSLDDLVGRIKLLDPRGAGAHFADHVQLDRKNCREWAKRFSVENMVNRYEELCNEALTSGGW